MPDHFKCLYDEQRMDWIKRNLIELAKYHKDRCDDPNCGIQLYAVQEAINMLGIELSMEDRMILI